jgi:hypothetical protein
MATRCNKQIKLAAQRDELAAHLTNGLAIVLAEICDRLEVRCQLPGQPDHLDIALAFPLQAPARRHAIEVAVDVELEHNTGVIAGSADVEWLHADKSELVEIETVDKHVDRSHRVILGHIVVERCRKKCALPAIQSFNKALHQMPRRIAVNLIARITAKTAFSHSLGPKLRLENVWFSAAVKG